jgi:hypothetical protein
VAQLFEFAGKKRVIEREPHKVFNDSQPFAGSVQCRIENS